LPAPENVAKELGSLLRAAQAKRLPSVSAAVVRKGEVLWADAVGYAGVEDEREATPETQYRIGSITKTFTATAIVQLREAGELGLDDPLSKHLPDAHHGQPTLRRMLAHLSGLQREPHGDIWESLESPDDAGLLAGLAHAEQVLEPAQAHHYSNLAFALLGHVVAARSGMPYRDYVDERIIRPLGLERTSWEREEPSALGYLVDPYANVAKREHDDVDLRGASAAGQLWSTTADLCRWAAFLAEGHEGVLAPGAVERMWFPQVMWDPDAWTLGWGLGLMLMRRGDRVFGGHGGGMPGHLSGVYVDRKSGIGGVALTNSGSNAEMDELAVALALEGDRAPARRSRAMVAGGGRAAGAPGRARALVVGGSGVRLRLEQGQARGAARHGARHAAALRLRAGRRGDPSDRLRARAGRAPAARPRRAGRDRADVLGDVPVHAHAGDVRALTPGVTGLLTGGRRARPRRRRRRA